MNKFYTLVFSVLTINTFAQFPIGTMGGAAKPKTTVIPGTFADSQTKGTGKITGYVIDSAATKAVEFANIGLINKANNKPVDGTTADEKGKFTMKNIAKGNYKLLITFIGFKTYSNDNIVIDEKGSNIDLGVVKLSQNVQTLEEVTVAGQKSLIEDKVDRLVYNAEKDATSAGGDATDVLKKVPMLSVDLDGNVSLRGNSNVKVLINNKPSSIMAATVADAMKQIPADMIKSVEVITSPSARYDAEGSSGIINIITKKNNLQGLTLNIDSSVGIRGGNMSLGGNYRKGKMGFSLGGFGRANYNINGAFENMQTTTNATSGEKFVNIQNAETRNSGAFGQYRLGWDYDINKQNSVSASFRYGLRNQYNFQDKLLNQQFNNTGSLVNSNTRDVELIDNSGSYDLNLDYTHTYAKPQKELSILTQFSRNNRVNDFINVLLSTDSEILAKIKNDNISSNQEMTTQLDFQNPLSKTQQIEMGVKGIFRKVTSDFKYFFAQGNGQYQESADKQLANVFDYDQNVIGTYLSLTSKLGKKYSSKIGARYEYTEIDASFAAGEKPNIPSYGILVPSLTISKNLKGGSSLKASYNRRIQRPSLQFLNPNINKSNPLSISEGNPLLDPEFTNNFEVTLNTFLKNTFLTISAFARNTNNAIESLRDVVENQTIRTSYANIGQQNAYGINLFGNYSYKTKLQLGAGGDVYYVDLKNNVPNPIYNASNSGVVANFRVFGGYNLAKGWGLQLFSFYRANQVQLQGSQGGFGIYSLSLKKDFANKKGSIGFGGENFFTPEFRIRNEITSPIISQKSIVTLRNTNVKINFSYRIGKMTFDAPKRKKSINNDDVKDGGDSGAGGGQQAAPAAAPAGGGRGPR